MTKKNRRTSRRLAPKRTDDELEALRPFWTRPRLALAVVALLSVHFGLAVASLTRENPTVDEVAHLPAGVTYWQKGTFRLYPHNPPLVKLFASLPVALANPRMDAIYQGPNWRLAVQAGVAHEFQKENASRYFELFERARLLMPTFSVLCGWVVFAWSKRLFGAWGGLLSLSLWCFCPNVLAHARLVTTDIPATALGFAATWLFWRYLKAPDWRKALIAGLGLGLAEATKFSMLALFALWPILWIFANAKRWPKALGRGLAHGAAMLGVCLLIVNLIYGFEGTFTRLGDYPFVSAALSRPRARPRIHSPRPVRLNDRIREYRINRFQGTVWESLPTPLPYYYLTGFDEQKLEADGVWTRFLLPPEIGDRLGPEGEEINGYPVYLDGVLSRESWWYYYLFALIYKVPEGTWLLAAAAAIAAIGSKRARAEPIDEAALWLSPALFFGLMSFGTNINLGLRYVLPIFPYGFATIGRLAPWAAGAKRRRLAIGLVVGCLFATTTASLSIFPHYLAYFNRASGGPENGSSHLIDSNLDWGQDLVGLREWVRRNAAHEPIGAAVFGQIHPEIFAWRGDGFDWYLPPPAPGALRERPRAAGISSPPRPGLYAIGASLLRGLPWRVYSRERTKPYEAGANAYAYFQRFEPIAVVGHSIFIYRLTSDDVDRLRPLWRSAAGR